MDIVEKVYGENGIFNKLKIIKSNNFEIKDSYKSVIPLNIYLTWGTKKLPIKMQENLDRMKKVNPEFNIQLYDDDDCRKFIKNNLPKDILIAFDTLKPGAYKADLWRLCILYINGGIYIDIKFNCINNFKFIALTEREHLVIDFTTVNAWKEGEIGLHNALMVFKPKNELLLRCINKISNNVKNKYYDFNFLYPTGPGLLGEEYIKMLRENESTIEYELNKLDLCHKNYEHIVFNNVVILEEYKEYRTEQQLFGKTLHYGEIYYLKQIYNENTEVFSKNMNIEEKVYGKDGIYNKLKTIKSNNFEIKDSYKSVIPLNIYLTWGTKKLPIKMQENVDRMRIINPEFNIQLYDDDDCREFIQNNFHEDILTAFDTLKPGAYKADLWRLCVLYINGGIYADIKFNCINNFKFIALTEREHFVIDIHDKSEKGKFRLFNALLVVKPNNELLLRCINKISENVKNKYYGFNDLYPTGPGLLGEEYIKMLRENESTMDLELNKLDLCLNYLSLGIGEIIFNNVPILEYYKEYRTEQKLFAKTQHYSNIYKLKQIYNEINNCNKNTSIFNIYNLILFCAIIITLLILYKLK